MAQNQSSLLPDVAELNFSRFLQVVDQFLWNGRHEATSSQGLMTIGAVAALLAISNSSQILQIMKWLSLWFALRQWRLIIDILKYVLPHPSYLSAYAALEYLVLFIMSGRKKMKVAETAEEQRAGLEADGLQPFIFPCRTTHTRLNPTGHSFGYSYLLVGIPVDWEGRASTILSCNESKNTSFLQRTWFSVSADDYLERGNYQDGLAGKLKDYLVCQDVDPEVFRYCYLVTAPRFLGFSFNPVSFWYLYDNKWQLKAMILEVNNTFDERRMYFMQQDQKQHPKDSDKDEALHHTTVRTSFNHTWSKDFHVSPFNDREGKYSLKAEDPHPFDKLGTVSELNNTITLKSGSGTIVARVFSTQPGMPAYSMSRWQILWFVLRWWWVGFMTEPRILREARILWVKKLKVFYRPEVFVSSIGRRETKEENAAEPFFKQFLQMMADCSGISFLYSSAAGADRGRQRAITPRDNTVPIFNQERRVSNVEVKILTPAFYSELVRAVDIRTLFDRLCFQAVEGESMLHVSNPDEFRTALDSILQSRPTSRDKSRRESLLMSLRSQVSTIYLLPTLYFSLMPFSRRNTTSTEKGITIEDVLSSQTSSTDASKLRSLSLTVLLSDRLALGFSTLLRFYITFLRILLSFVIVRCIEHMMANRS